MSCALKIVELCDSNAVLPLLHHDLRINRSISPFTSGALVQPCNAVSVYTAAERKRGKSRTIVRPTSYPREVLIDTCGIFGIPGEFSEPTSPQTIENGSQIPSRSPFCPPDLL